jgi:hypothetical protein
VHAALAGVLAGHGLPSPAIGRRWTSLPSREPDSVHVRHAVIGSTRSVGEVWSRVASIVEG